jgi:hypothetical protein
MIATYTNRYKSTSTFTLQEDGNILWEGDFKWCRFGMPNDYTKAYDTYCKDHIEGFYDGERLTIEQFKVKVHEYDKELRLYPMMKYLNLTTSRKDIIDMVDPSGGPYLAASDDMGRINEAFSGMIIKEFTQTDTGYLIIVEK